MVKMIIKITEDKKVSVGDVQAIGFTCDLTVKGILPTKSELEAVEVLKKKLGFEKRG